MKKNKINGQKKTNVFALAAWRAAKRVRSTEPKASPEGSDPFRGNALILVIRLLLVVKYLTTLIA
jgi:hypothetical protein